MHEGLAVSKIWGMELILTSEAEYTAKLLSVKSGFECSLHLHPKKAESFIVLSGRGWAVRGTQTIPLTPGAVLRIERGQQHKFAAVDGDMLLLEVSTHHSDDDVVRRSESRALEILPMVAPLGPFFFPASNLMGAAVSRAMQMTDRDAQDSDDDD